MSAVDNALSNEANGSENNGGVTEKGKQEIRRGMADLKGRNSAPAASSSSQTSGLGTIDEPSGELFNHYPLSCLFLDADSLPLTPVDEGRLFHAGPGKPPLVLLRRLLSDREIFTLFRPRLICPI